MKTNGILLSVTLAALAFTTTACRPLPNELTLGHLESPCTDASDCDLGVCVEWEGARFCSSSCTENADCVSGYECSDAGECLPAVTGICHARGEICGAGTDPCCGSSICVAWAKDLPPTCAVACDSYADCDNADVVSDSEEYIYTFCCLASVGACALEPYCD